MNSKPTSVASGPEAAQLTVYKQEKWEMRIKKIQKITLEFEVIYCMF